MYYYILKDLLTRGVYIYTLDDAKERIDYGVANGLRPLPRRATTTTKSKPLGPKTHG